MRAGLWMLAATALAILLANSPGQSFYGALLEWPLSVGIEPLVLRKSLLLWVNEALVASFFLLVGIEIKREMKVGLLRTVRQATLPVVAALGGMAVPALIFVALTGGAEPVVRGWAIPCATDIAFSLVLLRLVAPRAPAALPLFLTAVAVIDDLGAIVIIALFYADDLSTLSLVAATAPLATLVILNRRGTRAAWPYLLAGSVLWVCVLKSGVHATMAGVLTALAMPAAIGGSAAERVEHRLKPWVDYGVLPLFAFFNAGVALSAAMLAEAQARSVAIAIAVSLLVGKTLGVTLATMVGVRLLSASLPGAMRWRDLWGMAALAGIGFTMSLFIASLAYEAFDPRLFDAAKLGVLAGSILAALAGAILLAHRRRA